MRYLIVDYLSLINDKQEYLPVELSFTDGVRQQSFSFNHSDLVLKETSQKINKYLKRKYHGLSLQSGDVQFSEFQKIVSKYFLKFDVIFIRGVQKVLFLQKFTSTLVFDLNKFNCEKHYNLKRKGCFFHDSKTHLECAIYNARSNYLWLDHFFEIQQTKFFKELLDHISFDHFVDCLFSNYNISPNVKLKKLFYFKLYNLF